VPGGAYHLLYVINGLGRSGAEKALADMAPYWIEAGVRLDVAYFDDKPGLQHVLTEAGATLHYIGPETSRPALARSVTQVVRRLRPDLIHTTLFEADLAGRFASVVTRIPNVTSLVNMAYGPEQLAATPKLRKSRLRAAQLADALSARAVRRFHAITEEVAEVMGRRLMLPRSRVEVVRRGRDPVQLGEPGPQRKRKVRERLGLGEGDVVVLAAARHEPQKGLDVLVRALPNVRQSHPTLRFLLAGREGNQTPLLIRLLEQNGLREASQILGERSDVADLMCAADVWVEPSRWEGGPGAVLEAMALEVPMVVSDLPVYREAITDLSATLVPPDDPVALAEAILGVLADRPAAAERAGRARARFLERFTVERVATEMMGFHERALRRTAAAPDM
jgi:glycosyltransferase involved in cell wall biosynthesis